MCPLIGGSTADIPLIGGSTVGKLRDASSTYY